MEYTIHTVPVSPFTEGHDTDLIVVDEHYFPGSSSCGSVSFVVSHAVGFHKEVYHPLFSRIEKALRCLETYKSMNIYFYGIDARCHGDSSLLNSQQTHSRTRWTDLALDIRNVIDVLDIKSKGNLYAIGHSMGAACSILCQDLFPETFDGMLILEPAILPDFVPLIERIKDPVYRSSSRREEWENRKQFEDLLFKKSFWKSFHPEIIEKYKNYGVFETEKGTIKLKCPKDHENGVSVLNTTKRLRIPVHYVFGEQSFLRDSRADKIIRFNSKNTSAVLKGSHMVPFENPDAIALDFIKRIEKIEEAVIYAKL